MRKREIRRKEFEDGYLCCICHKHFKGIIYDPRPLKRSGACCENCYKTKVFEAKKKSIDKLWEVDHANK